MFSRMGEHFLGTEKYLMFTRSSVGDSVIGSIHRGYRYDLQAMGSGYGYDVQAMGSGYGYDVQAMGSGYGYDV